MDEDNHPQHEAAIEGHDEDSGYPDQACLMPELLSLGAFYSLPLRFAGRGETVRNG